MNKIQGIDVENPIDLKRLKDPIESRWRVQSFSKQKPKAICIPYIDSRDVQNRLDEVCGPQNWQDDYRVVNGNLYAGIGIKIAEEWVWKWDCGTESAIEKEKGEASDSFKRAGVKWGIGRDLYEMDTYRVRSSEPKNESNSPYVVDENKKRIYDLTLYIRKQMNEYPIWWNKAIDYMKNGGSIEPVEEKHGKLPNWPKLKKELLAVK